jgi:hypothetical protein
MPGFKITTFKGAVKKVAPRLLADEFAQSATNCYLGTGDLLPYMGKTQDWTLTKAGPIKTIYKYAQGATNEDPGAPVSKGYWFHWDSDIDVVQSPIVNDVNKRVYFTGTGLAPQITDFDEALDGTSTDYPVISKTLGIPEPAFPPETKEEEPVLDANGIPTGEVLFPWGTATSTDSLDAENRFYVYTYVHIDGDIKTESAPSLSSNAIYVQQGQTPWIEITTAPNNSGHKIVDKYRLYVTTTGSNATDYQFCAESSAAIIQDDGTRAEVLATSTWVKPDVAMVGIVAMSNGIIAGFKDNTIMFSEPYAPYTFPVEYQLGIPNKIVGLGVAGDNLVVCTEAIPYLVNGATSSSMAITPLSLEQSCVSKRSIVSILDGVIYASPDGLVYIDSAGPQLITNELFTREQWQAYKPETIHAYQHDNLYYVFYDDTAGFILDPINRHFIDLDFYASAGYNDPVDDALYLVVGGEIVRWNHDATTDLSYTWKSKVFTSPRPVNFSTGQVIADSYPVTIDFYVDGENKNTTTVNNADIFRLPSGFLGRDWEVEISGTSRVEAVYVADSVQSLRELA